MCGQYKGQLKLGNSYAHISSESQIGYQENMLYYIIPVARGGGYTRASSIQNMAAMQLEMQGNGDTKILNTTFFWGITVGRRWLTTSVGVYKKRHHHNT